MEIGIKGVDPFLKLKMKSPLDLDRVRKGESKYLLRELYKKIYPQLDVPEKIAMTRSVDVWLGNWEGPKRSEFIPGCVGGLTGEQKFMIMSLERFMDDIDELERGVDL